MARRGKLPTKGVNGDASVPTLRNTAGEHFMTSKYRLIAVSLLSTTMLTGCVVWQSDYDKLQSQNQQLQQQLATSQQEISRLQGAIKYTVNSDLLFAPGSWQMRPQGQQVIANLAKKLAPTQQNPSG